MEQLTANELRIGNLINYWEYVSGVWKISKVDWADIKIQSIDPIDNYRPIPLTEEWLLKFGFEVNTDYASEDNNWYDYLKNYVRISMPYFTYNFENGESEIEIKYVHQLQNLYFALTGEELTIKEL
jgi:hypothetical protein